MATFDQLELISPNGDVLFYTLDPHKGISNLGRHPENDIVLDDPDIDFFHAVLDHRQKPYNIVVLSHEGINALNGESLSPNVARTLQNWDTLQLGSHTLILMETEQSGAETQQTPASLPPPSPAQTRPPTTPVTPVARPTQRRLFGPPSATRPTQGAAAMGAGAAAASMNGNVGQYATRPPDQTDSVIITEMEVNEWGLSVEQTVSGELTIINGGDLVASFDLNLVGLDPNWVTISQPRIYLNEGDRTSIAFNISPPRSPNSRAGVHHFAVVVTSPNYPEHRAQLGASLTLEPYYEFAVSELSPKQQTISWFRKAGQTRISLANRGNSRCNFRLQSEDDERGCSFELQVPGETVSLARQAELRLFPEEVVTVPINITPYSRSLIAFSSRAYSFNVTAELLDAQQSTPRSVLGRLTARPLIGPWLIMLLSLLLLILFVYLLRPRIYEFRALDEGGLRAVVNSGEVITLAWEASWFADWEIDAIGPLNAPEGTATVVPQQNTTYELRVNNFLSGLFPAEPRQVEVIVTPVLPQIVTFALERTNIVRGENVAMFIDVRNADEVVLQTDEETTSLDETEHNSVRRLSPQNTARFVLIARNQYGAQTEERTINVNEPTATPVPPPQILSFSIEPRTVTRGESVQISWQADGAETVFIDAIGLQALPSGNTIYTPPESSSYVLRAVNQGVQAFSPVIDVIVVEPTPTATPTPEPLAPIIEFFTISDNEVVRGGDVDNEDNPNDNNVTLAWSVIGETTDIQLSGSPDFGTLFNLSSQGSINVSRQESTTFILTAFNNDKKSSQTVNLTVLEPTPTPEPTATLEPTPTEPPPTPVPTATGTPPPARILTFKLESATGDIDEVQLVGSTTSRREYQVLAGARVTLNWVVVDAAEVTIDGTEDYAGGSESLEGDTNFTVTQEGNYRLVAVNANTPPDQNEAVVQIRLVPRVPPAPTNVDGEERPADNVNLITWEFNGQDSDFFLGFRVYRANVNDNNFRNVSGDIDKTSTSWEDADADPTCDRVYYVVAYYLDPTDNQTRETDASTNSWYSEPCAD